MRGVAIGAGLAVLLPACIELGVYRCGGEDSCVDGRCEASGYCSYEDDSCESGRRYSDLAAGALASACVEPEGATSSGSGSGSESGAAVCGNGIPEADEACDDGDDIDGNGCNVDCRESGSVVWTVTYAGTHGGRDTGYAVVVLGSGDVVAGGSEQTTGPDDMLMVRLQSADGGEVWKWRRGGDDTQRIEGLAINAIGEIVAGGIEVAPDEVDTAWMGVFDGSGELTYDDHPPGTILFDVVGNAGGFIVGGETQGAGYDGFVASYPEGTQSPVWTAATALAGDDVYVAIDRAGADDLYALAWVDDGAAIHRVGPDGVEPIVPAMPVQPQGAAFHDPSGGLVVVGFQVTAFANDAWIGLVGPDGDELWGVRERDVELEVDEEFEDVCVDAEGNIIAAGFRTGDDKDAWVRKYDAAGTEVWTRRFEAPGTSVARAVDVDGEGNIAIAGEIDGADGSLDFWVAKLAR